MKAVTPVIAEALGATGGIGRPDVAQALKQAYEGVQAGVYRKATISCRLWRARRKANARTARQACMTRRCSVRYRASVPVRQVVSDFETRWEDTLVMRRNRARTIEVWCDPEEGLASTLLERLMPKVEAILLPEGYALEWGRIRRFGEGAGEHRREHSGSADHHDRDRDRTVQFTSATGGDLAVRAAGDHWRNGGCC